MTTSLEHLRPGDKARVIGFAQGSRDYRQRLLAMGVTPGAVLSLIRVAPLGDPIELHVRNFSLTLRKAEAAILRVERI